MENVTNIYKKLALRLLPYVVIVIGLLYMFAHSYFKVGETTTEIIIDTVFSVEKIPAKTGSFKAETLQPIIVYPVTQGPTNSNETNEYLQLFESLKANQEQTNKLLAIIAKKEYHNHYADTIIELDIYNVVENGKLISQKADWKVKEQFLETYKVFKEIRLKPKFVISTGIGINSGYTLDPKPTLKAIVGFKNKKGLELQLGYSANNRVDLIVTQDIFTKF